MSLTNRKGFTLLEIMLAVMVLGMIILAIYRFVTGTLQAVQYTREHFQSVSHEEGVANFLRHEIENIPVSLGAIAGEAHVFGGIPCDELRWMSRPGAGLLTRYGKGEYIVTLTAQKVENGTGYELGLRRQDSLGREASTWYPLFKNVAGFEVRFFDSRSQEWLEKWTDVTVRPSLVRVKIWRDGDVDPQEVVVSVPYASAMAQMPNFNFAPGNMRRRNNRQRGSIPSNVRFMEGENAPHAREPASGGDERREAVGPMDRPGRGNSNPNPPPAP